VIINHVFIERFCGLQRIYSHMHPHSTRATWFRAVLDCAGVEEVGAAGRGRSDPTFRSAKI
jgi:hypothetical protein